MGWEFVTLWGNALFLLPVALCIGCSLVLVDRRVAWSWAVSIGSAVLLVAVSKIAFLGWGIGSRALDFTGVSGHAMLASAVLPTLAWWAAQGVPTLRRSAIAAAVALALFVGVSRVVLDTHSWSEVVAGLALGFAVAYFAVRRPLARKAFPVFRWSVVGALVVATTSSVGAPVDVAHGIVERMALQLSGRSAVFTRQMLDDGTGARSGHDPSMTSIPTHTPS